MWKVFSKKNAILGSMLSELYSPNIPRIFSTAALDFVLVDCEHGSYDYTQIAAMASCAKALEFPLLIRVPQVERDCMLKYLEMGAAGLLVPMVESSKMVKQAVAYTKYAPLGKRGISTCRSHNNYYSSGIQQYLQTANENTLLLVQIETRTALSHLSEISSVPGLDGIVIGPNDLSFDLGCFGNYETPQMEKAIAQVIYTAKENHILSGIISSNLPLLNRCKKAGMEFLSWGSELSMIQTAISGAKKQLL